MVIAQAGAHNIRKILSDGDQSALTTMRPDTWGTADQFMKAMATAPVLQIVQKVNNSKYL